MSKKGRQLLQKLYSVRSERLLTEEIGYSILYLWFVGLNLDEKVWDAAKTLKKHTFCPVGSMNERRAGLWRPSGAALLLREAAWAYTGHNWAAQRGDSRPMQKDCERRRTRIY